MYSLLAFFCICINSTIEKKAEHSKEDEVPLTSPESSDTTDIDEVL